MSHNKDINEGTRLNGGATSYTDDACDNATTSKSYTFSSVPNFFWIEFSLLTNVFLAGYDGTVAASTYTIIGNEFNAMELASWITASYLITATAFQPLYGSFSDSFGRKYCVMFALVLFFIGTLGCAFSPNMLLLNIMRSITGIGGGGLITLSTIINSDIVKPNKRGLFQAFQNLLLGFGAVCGASTGGKIATDIGWRWCFYFQCPLAILSLFVAYNFIKDQPGFKKDITSFNQKLKVIDIKGAIILVLALTMQLFYLTLGGSKLAWTDLRMILLGALGIFLSIYFFQIESQTFARPIIPIKMLKGLFSFSQLVLNFLIGFSSYAYLFTLPLLFQLSLGDSPAEAGYKLIIPSFATPIGGIISGLMMSRNISLKYLVLSGTFLMCLGNALAILIGQSLNSWKINLLLVPANLGQGLAYPSSLFTFIFAFGKENQATSTSTVYLMRSIGSVWGVSGMSTIIHSIFKMKASQRLRNLGYLLENSISKIVNDVGKSIEVIDTFPGDIKNIVVNNYVSALRIALFISAISCGLSFIVHSVGELVKKELSHSVDTNEENHV